MKPLLLRIALTPFVTLAVPAALLLLAKPTNAAEAEPLTLTGQTGAPDFNVFVAGERAPLQFTVRGTAPENSAALTLNVAIKDEHAKIVDQQQLAVQANAAGWNSTLFAPSGKLGFYRVYATLSNGVTLPAQGSHKAGFLTYCVVQDPATRVSYGPDEARYGMQGGFNGALNPAPYLGIHWVNGPGAWKGTEPEKAGQFAAQRSDDVRQGKSGPSALAGATRGYEWSYVVKDGKKTGWPIYPIFSLYRPPDWATIPDTRFGGLGALQPSARASWDAYCRAYGQAVAQDYPDLSRHFYQITWEPNWFNGSQEEFVEIYRIAATALRAADPKALIAGPTKSGIGDYNMNQEQGWFRLGLGNLMDGYTIHPYTKMPAESFNYVQKIRGITDFVGHAAGRQLPIYATEQGYATHEDTDKELDQARFLTRASLIALGEGYQTYVAFYLHDYKAEPGFGYFYNLRDDQKFGSERLAPKPIVPAFAAQTSLIDGHQTVGPLSLQGANQLGYAFQRGHDIVLALWDSGETPSEAQLQTGSASVKVFDWMGNSRIVATPGGTLKLALGPEPVYIIGAATKLYGHEAVPLLRLQTPTSRLIRATPGQELALTCTLGGTGEPALRARLQARLLVNSTAPAGPEVPVVTSAGRGKEFVVKLAVPANLAPGNYPALVTAIAGDRAVAAQRLDIQIEPPLTIVSIRPLNGAGANAGVGTANSLAVTLSAAAGGAVRGNLNVDAPLLGLKNAAEPFELKAGETRQIQIACPEAKVAPDTLYPATVTATSAANISVKQEAKLDFLTAPRVKNALKPGDGEALWDALPAVPLEGKERIIRSRGQYDGPADLSASVHLGHDDNALYIMAEVRDNVHSPATDGIDAWQGDSLQLAVNLDPDTVAVSTGDWVNDALAKSRASEFTFALTPEGPRVTRSVTFNPKLYPTEVSTSDVPVAISRQDDVTTYRITLPWRCLGETAAAPHGNQLGFALAVNDRDSADQITPKVLGLFGGIYPLKDTAQLGSLWLSPESPITPLLANKESMKTNSPRIAPAVLALGLAMPSAALVNTVAASAQEWKLQPTTGHEANVWKEGPNWTWDQKNPRPEAGGAWSLWVQKDKDPALTSTYTPMEAGKAYGYFYVWSYGDNKKDPEHSYRDFILGTRPLDGTPQAGPSSVLRLKVPADGKYAVDLAGKANVQNVTAGHARLTVYILSADGQNGAQLSTWDLNADKPGAFGKFPSEVNYLVTAPLKKGEELAVRLQSINPGPATSGSSSFEFSRFTVKRSDG